MGRLVEAIFGRQRGLIRGLLESRLDAVVYRAKFVPTPFAARQVVNHGHVQVNGKRVNIASYKVKPGDTVAIREKSRNMALILEAQQSAERDQEKRKKIAWEIDRKLTQDAVRPMIYYMRGGTCWRPEVKNMTIMQTRAQPTRRKDWCSSKRMFSPWRSPRPRTCPTMDMTAQERV